MQKITPFLWFDHNAEEAMNFYVSIFKNSKIVHVSRYGEAGPGPTGAVMLGHIEIEGQEFLVLNGGPQFSFTQAVSFVVNCDTQQEIDYYWEKLSAGGKEIQCGWLVDKFGLSWQITPTRLIELIQHPKAMQAMLKMVKIDIAEIERAAKS